MSRVARGWWLVAGLTLLALLLAFIFSLVFPDASNGLTPRPPNLPPDAPNPPGGIGRVRVRGGFDEQLTGFWRYLAQLFSLLGAALIVLFFLPRQIGNAAAILRSGPAALLRTAVVGLVGTMIAALLTFLVSSSTLAPIAAVVAISFLAPITVVGISITALALGRTIAVTMLREPAPNPYPDLLSGLLLIFILLIIPVVGLWLTIIAAAIGLGGLLLNRQSDNRAAFAEIEY